jgi:hypothetical protein
MKFIKCNFNSNRINNLQKDHIISSTKQKEHKENKQQYEYMQYETFENTFWVP